MKDSAMHDGFVKAGPMTDGNAHDSAVLDLVDGSLGGVHMRRPVEEITARGRRLRTRRRSIAGAAAVGVLGVSLAITLPLSGASPSGQPAVANGQIQSQQVNADLAGFSVHTNADSTVTLTLRQLHDPAKLRQVLAEAGVPTIIARSTPPDCVKNRIPGPTQAISPVYDEGNAAVVKITPAAMPAGSVLLIEYLGSYGGHPVAISLALLSQVPPTCRA